MWEEIKMFDINNITEVLNFREKIADTRSIWRAYKYPTNYGKRQIIPVPHDNCVSIGYYKISIDICMDTVDRAFTIYFEKEFIKDGNDNITECCDVIAITISKNIITTVIDADYYCWFKGFSRTDYGIHEIYDIKNPGYSQELESVIKNIPMPSWSDKSLNIEIRNLVRVLYEITNSPTVHFIPGKGVVGVYGKIDK